jgi:tetratricopeptide (TPR) repeat protein
VASQRAKEAAERALKIDPNQSTAKCTLASVLFDVNWLFERAEAMLREILEYDPTHLYTLISLGQLHLALGRIDEAMDLFLRARSLDPIDSTVASSVYMALRVRGLCRQALAEADRMESLHPNAYKPHLWRAEVSFLTGNYRNSVEQFQTAFATPQGEPFAIHFAPFYLGALARTGDQDSALRQLELVRSHAKAGRTSLNHLAMAYCGISDMESCRLWLNRSLEKREQSFLTMRFEVYWDTLVADPVCSEIIQRGGVPI